MAEEKKQIAATEVMDRLTEIRKKIAFLHDAVTPTHGETCIRLEYDGAEGLGFVLEEIEGQLGEIEDARIVTPANGNGKQPKALEAEAATEEDVQKVPLKTWVKLADKLIAARSMGRTIYAGMEYFEPGSPDLAEEAIKYLSNLCSTFPVLQGLLDEAYALTDI